MGRPGTRHLLGRSGAPRLDAAGHGTARTLVLASLPRAASQWVNVGVYGVLVVMGTLGVVGIQEAAPRAVAVGLCLLFGLLQAWADRSGRDRAAVVLAQTAIVGVLLALPSSNFEAFGFLLYVLSIEVALQATAATTTAVLGLFWAGYSLAAIWRVGADSLIGILFALGVFPFCGLLGYLLRETARARAEGEATLSRLRAAQSRIEELAVTEERHRLARDLHDSVKQHIFATTMQLGAARAVLHDDPEAARAALAEADTSVGRAAAELNVVIQELRPLDLDERGLEDALRAHVADWARRAKWQADVRVEGEPRTLPGIDEALLRVAQEAVANAARHSRARHVEVVLTYRPTSVRLRIRDDGRGFDPEVEVPGVGLDSMRARVEERGGRFRLHSTPGSGTRIDIHLEEP